MISFDPVISLRKRAQIGCVAGLVGGFAIFVSIFVIDLSMGSSQGSFYKIVGLAVGSSGLEATLIGMISHMLTACLIGTVFGLGSGMNKKLDIHSIKKGAIAGITTGLVVFGVFFVPISLFVIMPIIQSSNVIGESSVLLANSNLILISSLELHVVFGVVMGVFFAIAVQVESKSKFTLFQEA
ncbi:MAG: hypothetical protein FJ357_05135 [Thaumarchaeota archaeon]|nr:hypothetical protein [Nitrososphaerota archaeon]